MKGKQNKTITVPEQMTLAQLEKAASCYYESCEFLNYIEALVEGGRYINNYKKQLMPQRVDEDIKMYNKRLNLFVYTNIIGAAITETLNKFSQGSIAVDFSNNIKQNKTIGLLLNKFRNSIDDEGNTELVFCLELLRKAMIFKEVYVMIDFPTTEQIGLSEIPQSLVAQLNASYIPYLVIYDPRSVLIEGENWYKIRTIEEEYDTLGNCYYNYEWKFVDSEKISTFTAKVLINERKVQSQQNPSLIDSIWNGNEFVKVSSLDDIVLQKTSEIYHNQKGCPVIEFEMPCDKSLVEQIYQKQQQYTLIENGLTASTYASNAVQKLFKPLVGSDSGLPPSMEDSPKVGNEYLLMGEKFEFVEMTGSSIKTQMEVLENIERLIKQLVSLSGLSFSAKTSQTSSGYSKELEFSSQENSLVSYGKLFIQFYEKVLSQILGLYIDTFEVNVSGLDSFSLKTPSESLDLLKKATDLKEYIAPTALKQLQLKTSAIIADGASVSDLKMIADEIITDEK